MWTPVGFAVRLGPERYAMDRRLWFPLVTLTLMLASCNFAASPPLFTPLSATQAPSATPAEPAPEPSATPEPTPEPTPWEPASPRPPAPGNQEVIMILEPGPGSRLISPARVAGMTTWAQDLTIRLVDFEGHELAALPVALGTDINPEGRFEARLAFEVGTETNALLQIYTTSPRDGGITHLSSAGVVLLPSGETWLAPWSPYPEQIQILEPAPGAEVQGGVAHVEGVGVASFEGTLVVQVLDAAGRVVGSQPLIVQAPDMGLPGAFGADVGYEVDEAGPGRLVVLDPSPAFDGVSHLASVEIWLAP